MLQKTKRLAAVMLSILMCISMFTCIVLPTSLAAEVTPASESTDPYAAANQQATQLTVTDGRVSTTDGYSLDVPEEYQYDTIYEAGDKINFYDPEWTAESLGIEDEEGAFFFYRYGNDSAGSEWGNGKVYLLQWRVNAYGAVQYGATKALDGTTLSSAGSCSGWADMLNKLRFVKPVVDADNSQYVFLCPGTVTHSTGNSGSADEVTFTKPDTTSDKNIATEFEKEDYTNVYLLGPQAGKDPTSGVVGDESINNYRGDDPNKEIVFTSTLWGALDAVYHIDGIAMSGTNKINVTTKSDSVYVCGLYITNTYFNLKHTDGVWATVGTNNTNNTSYTTSNTVITAFHLTNSYYYSETANATGSINYLQANDLLLDNVVMNNINGTGDGAQWRFEPCNNEVIDNAFLGEYRNDYHAEVTNCTFKYKRVTRMFSIYNAHYTGYSSPDVLLKGNHFSGYVSNLLYGITTTKSGGPTMRVAVILEDNYLKSNVESKNTTECQTIQAQGSYAAGNGGYTINNNIFISGTATQRTCDVYSTAKLVDASGNLFMTHDGKIRAARGSYISNNVTANLSVCSDLYVSDEMSGGVKELFTLSETADNAVVTYSNIQLATLRADTADYLRGAATLILKDGETFPVKDLFKFKDKNVKLIGFYDEAECENGISDLRKGFGTTYAKFEYKTENTTATVLYTIVEPSQFHIVDPTGTKTEYTFNGTNYSYTNDNVTFYASIADALDAVSSPSIASDDEDNFIAYPSKSVILLMPGSYNTGKITIAESVGIVGPAVFTAASDGTDNVATGRSYTDDTTEAIIGVDDGDYFSIQAPYSAYVALVGFAAQPKRQYIQCTGDGTGSSPTASNLRNSKMQTMCFLNIVNACVNQTTNVFLIAGMRTKDYMPHYIVMTNIRGSYIANSSNYIYNGVSNYLSVTNSTLKRNGSSNVGIYMTPVPTKYFGYTPAEVLLSIEDSRIVKTKNSNQRSIYYYSEYYSDEATDGLKNGGVIKLHNNTIYDDTDYSSKGWGADVDINTNENANLNLEITDNTLTFDSTGNKCLAYCTTSSSIKTTIENNIVINYAMAINMPGNSVDVDENYYGDSDGNVKPLTGNAEECGYVKSNWYYMDTARTLKTSSFAVDIGEQSYNAEGGDVVSGWEWTGNLPCGTTTIDADQIKASSDATLVGVYSDADCTTPVSGVIENAPLYAKTEYSGRTIVIAVNLATADEHGWNNYEVTVPITCTESGTYRYTCDNCGAEKDETQAPYGHYYKETAVNATCTADAGIYDICLRCGDRAEGGQTFENTALDHDWSEYVVTTEGNCVIDRVETRICQRDDCGVTEQIVTPAPDHSWSEWTQTVTPTCTETGLMERHCKNCTATDALSVAATGHKYESVTVNASCYQDGATYDECTVCGDIPVETYQTIVATGSHQWGNYITSEATCNAVGVKERFCKVCSVVDMDTRVVTPTDANKHVYDEAVTKVAGTCEVGATMMQTCTICKHVNVYTDNSTLKGDCKYQTVTTMPTTTQTGKVEKVCSVCGHTELVRLLARSTAFTDVVEGKWYVEPISKAVAYGLLKGYTDSTVRPNNNVTRAEAVTLIARVAGVDTAKYSTTKFSDVAAKAWYNGAVAWAEQNKIVSGRSDTIFDPNGHISRQELCTVLVRYANHADITLKAAVDQTTFADDASISAYAKENVYLCQKAGIVNGKTGNRFDPLGKATRAETAKILVTFMDDYVLNK